MSKSRNNHYVPKWYQKRFLSESKKLYYLDMTPDIIRLPNGDKRQKRSLSRRHTSKCFVEKDLYTTFFGETINDEIEREVFGPIDNFGSRAVESLTRGNLEDWREQFRYFFSYLDFQRIRTPKGLRWIDSYYTDLTQARLMEEMRVLGEIHSSIWIEGVHEIVSASRSSIKFILTDHPVTIYNYGFPPSDKICIYPSEPSILFKGTQTIFPLSKNDCLIITNIEYAKNPEDSNPRSYRTNPKLMRSTIVRIDKTIRTRYLDDCHVEQINYILKVRACRYIAASNKNWLYPERNIQLEWADLRHILLPPEDELDFLGGEMFIGLKDGNILYQDAFGRTSPENPYLKKEVRENIGGNDPCGCGSGKKYIFCCSSKDKDERPPWNTCSIRERNLILCGGIADILGMDKGKTWLEVRKSLSDDQVSEIYELSNFLWSAEVDIIDLLPRPDSSFRAVFSGIVDPYMIHEYVLGLVPFFDEIIIQSSFITPQMAGPDLDPIKSPNSFKQKIIKDMYLLLLLEPFIEAGIINFIPQIGFFEQCLQKQIFNMVNNMRVTINAYMNDSLKEVINNNLLLLALSESDESFEYRAKYMDKEREKYIRYFREDSQLLLLQDEIGEQFEDIGMIIQPQFEMSHFLAQITGSVLVTDLQYRWKELQKLQRRKEGKVFYPWKDITSQISESGFYVNIDPEESFKLHFTSDYSQLRNALRNIYSAIRENNMGAKQDTLKSEFVNAYNNVNGRVDHSGEDYLGCQVKCLAPAGGFVHNNAERLLFISGRNRYIPYVPMVMFVNAEEAIS